MKKSICFIFAGFMILFFFEYGFADSAQETRKVSGQTVRSGSHASQSAGHSVKGGAGITSAISVAPISVDGGSNKISVQSSTKIDASKEDEINKPLEISEEVVTAGPPPDEMLKSE